MINAPLSCNQIKEVEDMSENEKDMLKRTPDNEEEKRQERKTEKAPAKNTIND